MASDKQLLHKSSDNSQPVGGEPLPKRKSCTGYHVYKSLSIVYAIFYVLIGLLLLALGIWVTVIKGESLSDIISSPAALCIFVGVIILISAFVGCIGASIDRLWPLRIFLGIVIVVFVIQVVIGIIAYVYREEAVANVGTSLSVTIRRYHLDEGIEKAINSVQKKGRCCGLKGSADWELNPKYSCSANTRERCSVPDSCCRLQETDCGLNTRQGGQNDRINIRGCEVFVIEWIEHHLDVLGATALGFAILHILGIFVVYMFITKVEDRIRLFKYRKRFYPG